MIEYMVSVIPNSLADLLNLNTNHVTAALIIIITGNPSVLTSNPMNVGSGWQ